MRRVLIIAALGSVLLHGLALFSFDFGMFGEPLEPLPLVAEIRLLPPAPTPETQSVVEKSEPPPRKQPQAPRPPQPAREVPAPAVAAEPLPDAAAAEPKPCRRNPPRHAREPLLPASGYLKFVVIKESLGMQIGWPSIAGNFPQTAVTLAVADRNQWSGGFIQTAMSGT